MRYTAPYMGPCLNSVGYCFILYPHDMKYNMKKQYKKSIFIFRRDLRLEDNTGLLDALTTSESVIAFFIFDPAQVEDSNEFRSLNALQFMIASLQELDGALRKKKSELYIFYGHPADVIKKIILQEHIDAVFVNRDYTPFSIKRDDEIKKVCHQHQCAFISRNDLLLHEPEEVKSGNGTPYSIFTPFYKKSMQLPVRKPQKNKNNNFYTAKINGQENQSIYKKILKKENRTLASKGGRQEAVKILKKIGQFKNYAQTHDFPALATTHLSAHLKFGTVSIREAYWAIRNVLGAPHPLLRQLYWRDFFTHIAYQSPFVFGQPFHEKYATLPWENNKKDFLSWCTGNTGFPIVDAGMKEMHATGFMHNRVRMIVASFLIKDLHINWLLGEKYFAQQLVDYDPAVNNGNWQWVASTGSDAQPYFRIFNPWLQQKKFDPQCIYIKKWMPELKNIQPKILHTWYTGKNSIKNYPKPIIDHEQESKKAKKYYKQVNL